MKKESENNHEEHHHGEEIIKLIIRGLIPIVLLGGGLYLLDLRITGWSLIFGLPIIVIGTVFLIFTYDEIVTKKTGKIPPRFIKLKHVKCFNCGRETPRVPGLLEEDTLCPNCKSLREGNGKRKKEERKIKG